VILPQIAGERQKPARYPGHSAYERPDTPVSLAGIAPLQKRSVWDPIGKNDPAEQKAEAKDLGLKEQSLTG
jgi:hypothetical protein